MECVLILLHHGSYTVSAVSGPRLKSLPALDKQGTSNGISQVVAAKCWKKYHEDVKYTCHLVAPFCIEGNSIEFLLQYIGLIFSVKPLSLLIL
jgi:hypothetical protein